MDYIQGLAVEHIQGLAVGYTQDLAVGYTQDLAVDYTQVPEVDSIQVLAEGYIRGQTEIHIFVIGRQENICLKNWKELGEEILLNI